MYCFVVVLREWDIFGIVATEMPGWIGTVVMMQLPARVPSRRYYAIRHVAKCLSHH